MWQPFNLTTTRVTLDFSSSFGSHFQATQLNADSERLANAIELVDWSDDPIQVDVCEECGITQCKPGGWVTFRRCGQYVLVLPAFAAMADNDLEYSAPDFLLRADRPFSTSKCSRSFARLRRTYRLRTRSPRSRGTRPCERFNGKSPGHVLGRFPAAAHS